MLKFLTSETAQETEVGGEQLLRSPWHNWPWWPRGSVNFRVPIGIYILDKRAAVRASVPIAAGGCCRGYVCTKQGEGLHRVMLSVWNWRGKKQKERMEEKWIREGHTEIDWSQGRAFKYSLWEKRRRRKLHSSGIQASLNLWHGPENEAVNGWRNRWKSVRGREVMCSGDHG